MVRTQIQLTERQAKAIKERAKRNRVSMAAEIRRALDRSLEEENPLLNEEVRRRALAAVGFFDSGLGDLARNHDKYLAEDYLK